MRPTTSLRALAPALAALLLIPAAAPAARCPKGATPVGGTKAPRACVAKKALAPETQLRRVVAQARRSPKGARRSARAERLARRAFAFATARLEAGQPVFTTGPAPRSRMTVTDRAGAWGPDPRMPACATAEVTTTAGRAAPFTDTIEPEQPADLRIAIDVTYDEDMGPGIAKTHMRGVGTVDLGWRETRAEGTGGYDGTEWDGGIGNPCGADMLRTRGFTGTSTVGVTRNRDGTLSVAFVADERPLRMSFRAVVTTAGGTQFFTTPQPFCGEAGRALTSAVLRVSVTPLPPPSA